MALPDRLSEPTFPQDWLSSPTPPAGRTRRTQTAKGSRTGAGHEARRRMRLIRRRRLDLLQDAALSLLLAIFVLVESAGLGVVALLAAVTALGLVASLMIERRLRANARRRR